MILAPPSHLDCSRGSINHACYSPRASPMLVRHTNQSPRTFPTPSSKALTTSFVDCFGRWDTGLACYFGQLQTRHYMVHRPHRHGQGCCGWLLLGRWCAAATFSHRQPRHRADHTWAERHIPSSPGAHRYTGGVHSQTSALPIAVLRHVHTFPCLCYGCRRRTCVGCDSWWPRA